MVPKRKNSQNIPINVIGHTFLYHFKIFALTCLAACLFTAVTAQLPVAGFYAMQTSGCAPFTTTFINTSQNAISYRWDFGNGATSFTNSPVITYQTAGIYSVKLVALNNSGSDSIILQQYIHVENKPQAQFVANKTNACEGESIQFTNQSSSFDSCQWDFGDGVTSSQFNPQHIYNSSGTFNVTLVLYKLNSNCTEIYTRNAYIHINPLPLFSPGIDTFTTCNQNKIFLFNSHSSGTYTYTWSFGDGSSATGQNTQHQYQQPGSYQVSVTALSASGCSKTINLTSPVTILSNPQPVITASSTSGCNPFSTTLSVSTTSVTGMVWDLGNGLQSTLASVGALYLNPGVYQPNITVTYSNGCSNISQPLTINVLPSPSAQFNVSSTTGCKPLQVNFHPTTGTGLTYSWATGDGVNSSLQNFNYTYNQSGLYIPSLTVTAGNGCTATYQLPYGINVSGPKADFIASKTSGCNPLTVNFSNTSQNASVWKWYFGTGDSSQVNSPAYTYQQQGSYTVKLIALDANGCSDTLIKPNYIQPGSSTSQFSHPQPVFGCAPLTVTLSDSSGSNAWLWNFGDGATSTSQHTTHTYTTPGTYTVSLQTQSSGGMCSQTINNFATYIVGGGVVNFSYNQTLCPPFIGYFTDSSTNAVSWLWNFGDGQTSTQQNPTHTYSQTGSYTVSLTTTSADGCSTTAVHQYAMNFFSLGASPSGHTLDTVPPLNVQFQANSVGATSWLWSFGDGDSSTLENPLHTYTSPGPYTISLTITNDSCSYTYSYPPTSFGGGGTFFEENFDSTNYAIFYDGCAPLSINFNNPFINVASAHWDFGDGTTSSLLNPTHTYATPGIYDVMLIVTLTNGSSDTIYNAQAVKVAGTSAQFSVSASNSCSGTTVTLNPSVTGLTSYQWDFGDNQTSTIQAPSHTYAYSNNFVITLQTVDSNGCHSVYTTSFYAHSSSYPVLASTTRACAMDSVHFNLLNSNYANYSWSFGDGQTAAGNPVVHAYPLAGSYGVSVTVTDMNGCTQTFALNDSVIISKPVADFTVTTLGSNCSWVNVQLNNTSTGSNLFSWNLGDGTSSSQVDVNKYYYYNAAPAPYGYDITLTAYSNGCSSSKTITQAVVIPDFDVNFSYSRTQGCLPVWVTVHDSSKGAVSWKWCWGDGDTTFTQQATHQFTTIPTGKIKLIAKDVNGCEKSIEQLNLSFPKAGFLLSDTSGCSPYTISFIDTSTNAVTWQWNFGNNSYSTMQHPNCLYNAAGWYQPTLVVTDGFGCSDTATHTGIRITEPIADFNYTVSAGCAPVTAQFQNLSSGITSCQWDFGDGSFSNQVNPSHIYTNGGSYLITLTITDSAGCVATKTINSALIIPGPKANFQLSSNNGCMPLSINFIDSSLQAHQYLWSFGDGDTSVSSSPSHTYQHSGNFQATLIITDNNGCQSVFTHPDTIKVLSKPLADFALSDSAICSQTSVTLINHTTAATQYQWLISDGSSYQTFQPVHHFNNPGNYHITLIASNGYCSDTLQKQNAVKVVSIPKADFSGSPLSGCVPHSCALTNQSSSLQNPTFFWQSGNGLTSSAFNPQFQYLQAGHYNVQLTVVNDGICSDSMVKTNFITAINSAPINPSPILYVTVLDSQSIRIMWQNSAALNLKRYELLRSEDDFNYKLIYADTNIQNSSLNPQSVFIDNNVEPNLKSYYYKLRTFNTCDNSFPDDSSLSHATIYTTVVADTMKNLITWSAYKGNPVASYQIYRSSDQINFDLIAYTDSDSLSYTDTTALCPFTYTYKIEAEFVNSAYSSESNMYSATPVSLLNQIKTSIIRSTVINNESILTEWYEPNQYSEYVSAYNIYRSDDSSPSLFKLIDKVNAGTLRFEDFDVNVNERNYQYKIEVENICHDRTGYTDISGNILLNGKLNDMNNSVLEWSPYKEWKEGVERYEIQRQDENGNWKTIKTVDGKTHQFEEEN